MKPRCKLRSANDIDLMGGSNGECQDLTNRLVGRGTAYGMKSAQKRVKSLKKKKKKSTNDISADISMSGKKLEEVASSNTWEQHWAKMAPAQQKSASGLPQQW